MTCKLLAGFRCLASDDQGATAVEYCLIAVLIAAVIAIVVTVLGKQVNSEFHSVIGVF